MGSPLGPTLVNVCLCFNEKKNDLKNALLNLNQFFIEDVLIIFLFYSNQLIISKYFVNIFISGKKIVKYPFQMQKFHEKTVNLQQLFTTSLLLVVIILILRAFYLLDTNLVCFIPQYIDVSLYAQIGQNFIENL